MRFLTLTIILATCVSASSAADKSFAAELARAKKTASLLVCKKLEAKRKPEGLIKGASSFTAPRGNGRKGANGIAIGTDSKRTQNGTCWKFQYSMGVNTYGFQLAHPWKSGHILLTVLRGDHINLANNGSWLKGGWKGQEDIKLKHHGDLSTWGKALLAGKHEVVSRLGPRGQYKLFFDGKLVVSCTVKDAKPLDLSNPKNLRPPLGSGWGEHKFEGIEKSLGAGKAALIIAPCDRGPNVCHDIRFGPVSTSQASKAKKKIVVATEKKTPGANQKAVAIANEYRKLLQKVYKVREVESFKSLDLSNVPGYSHGIQDAMPPTAVSVEVLDERNDGKVDEVTLELYKNVPGTEGVTDLKYLELVKNVTQKAVGKKMPKDWLVARIVSVIIRTPPPAKKLALRYGYTTGSFNGKTVKFFYAKWKSGKEELRITVR
jgi:hypothetical protein